MPFFADLDRADPAVLGGKARSLVRLRAAGLPTPAAFVITDDLFRALRDGAPALPLTFDDMSLATLESAGTALESAPLPPGFIEALETELSKLGPGPYAVRSSFATEDASDALAPGVYESRLDVTAAEVPDAVRTVLHSAIAPGALAYALATGVTPASAPVAVLVHTFISGDAAGSAALAEPSAGPVLAPRTGQLSQKATNAIEQALRKLVAAPPLACGVEIEWVATADDVAFLQLRPYRPPPARSRWPGWDDLPAGESPPQWHWDAAHNPLPLSPAQAGLVQLVDGRCRTGIRQRLFGGYLFYAPGGPSPAEVIAPEQARLRFDAIRAQAERLLTELGHAPALEDALALFVSVYEPLFGVLAPAIRRGRAALEDFLCAHLPAALPEIPALLTGVESMAAQRQRRAAVVHAANSEGARARAVERYLELFGDEAPIWDVAAPTYGEAPHLVFAPAQAAPAPGMHSAATVQPPLRPSWTAAAQRIAERLAPAAQARWPKLLATARDCVALGEDDDWLYARIQAAVRRALVDEGRRLHRAGALSAPDDAFFCPLDLLRKLATGAPIPANLTDVAIQGKTATETARRTPPPPEAAGPPEQTGLVLKGSGTGGRALGRVWLRQPSHGLGQAPGIDAVLVATTLLPTDLPLLDPVAFVTETGGPLDHVAAQARERSLPAVVGVPGATAALKDGDLVLVDADRGLVIRLSGKR